MPLKKAFAKNKNKNNTNWQEQTNKNQEKTKLWFDSIINLVMLGSVIKRVKKRMKRVEIGILA